MTQEEMAYIVGSSRSAINNYENRGGEPKHEVMSHIIAASGFAKEDLLNKEIPSEKFRELPASYVEAVDYFREQLAQNGKPETYTELRRKSKFVVSKDIPVYLGNTTLGLVNVYSDDPEMQSPVGALPSLFFPSCDHAEKVSGDSMYPLIINQGLVVGKKIAKDGIIWGEKYGVHTRQGMSVVKFIHPSEKGAEYIKLVSYNERIPRQDISIDDVTFVFRVLYIINPA